MTQANLNILTADANTGITFRAAVNAALQALASTNSGPTAPATPYPYQLWADTTNNLLKMRDGANVNWVTLCPLLQSLWPFSEWVYQSGTFAFVDATHFTCNGDQTATFNVDRMIKATVSAGTVYGTITASSYSAGTTTVTVALDSGNLDNGLSVVYVGVLSETNLSVPRGLVIPKFYQDALKTKQWTIPAESGATAASQQTVQAGGLTYAADTGAADAYVVTLSPVPAWAAGLRFYTKIAHANATTTPTINPNGLGVKTIVRPDGSAVFVGDLPLNWMAEFEYYDATHVTVLNPFYPSSKSAGVSQLSGSLGTWSSIGSADGISRQATTDLLVFVQATSNINVTWNILGYTDNANPPTTARFTVSEIVGGNAVVRSACMVVKKGDYWEVTTANSSGTIVYTIPLGS